MLMCNLVEYSNNYLKTSESLLQYYRDVSNDFLTNSESIKFKMKITGKTTATGNTNDFWRTLEMFLINCEINLILTWSTNFIFSATGETKFAIADTKRYVSIVTSSTLDNAKLLEQLKSGFKRTINWNRYQSKVSPERENHYLDFLIDPSFQGVNRLFVLLKMKAIEKYTQDIISQKQKLNKVYD